MKKITLLFTLITSLSFSQTVINFDPNQFADGSGGIGFMNVFNHPQDGSLGGFVFGSGWGIGDLISEVTATTLELKPNRIGDPDPFWQTGNLEGNKIMEANHFFESTTLGGVNLTFTGNIASNTLDGSSLIFPFQPVAFIKVLQPGTFALLDSATVPVPATGNDFSVSLDLTSYTNNEIIQYGFQILGPNINFDPSFNAGYDALGSIIVQPAVLSDNDFEVNKLRVFPNPSNTVWNISGLDTTIEKVEVYDILGKSVMSIEPNSQDVSIDASALRTGLYLAKFSANGTTKTIRLVKN